MIFKPESTYCICCHSANLFRFNALASDSLKSNEVHIVECSSCGFAWQFPFQRTEYDSKEFFQNAYSPNSQINSKYFDPDYKQKVATLQLEFISQLVPGSSTLLDIGSGQGIFAEAAAQAGWNVTAIDPAYTAPNTNPHQNINFIQGNLGELNKDDLFQVITLWDVIEHVPDPLILLQEASAHLCQGGWLVLETGNYKSSNRIAGGLEHWIYQLDHRWYFSPESTTQLLDVIGLGNIVTCATVLRPGTKEIPNYLGPSKLQTFKSILKEPPRFADCIRLHFSLVKAKKWKCAGLSIFTMAAQKIDSSI